MAATFRHYDLNVWWLQEPTKRADVFFSTGVATSAMPALAPHSAHFLLWRLTNFSDALTDRNQRGCNRGHYEL